VPQEQQERDLASIIVRDRLRTDWGDLSSLMDSITRHGLMNPVTVAPDGTLVAGERRLEACRRLGWARVPWRLYEGPDSLDAEYDENEQRKAFTLTEAEDYFRRKREAAAVTAGHGSEIAEHEIAKETGFSRGTMLRMTTLRNTADDEQESPAVRRLAQAELNKLSNRTVGVKPALERVQAARRVLQRGALLPGQTSTAARPAKLPVNWTERLWKAIADGNTVALAKLAGELDRAPGSDTRGISLHEVREMRRVLDTRRREIIALQTVLKSIEQERKIGT
jgi:ParB family chromosome partitioning protein